ncbi:TetR/AcrR family transcriptional regulator [Paraconexibacter sp.]|uniref:TetR/AcrR family transcriptional regulator n=1 Tax=Paraconexibacter sp. TaxID=2949640 RepID=UPI0035651472
MIGETTSAPRRLTRAQQRVATRTALLEATGRVLVEEGYVGLTTRRVAEVAGVAQSTLMHHFPTREALLVETVTHLAMRLADDALEQLDLSGLRSPQQRDAILDQAWREFTSPPAIAAAQLWAAAWAEPELAAALRELEERLGQLIAATAGTLFPDLADDPRFAPLLDASVSLIRGLVMAIPVSGQATVDARWAAIKPILADAAGRLLD